MATLTLKKKEPIVVPPVQQEKPKKDQQKSNSKVAVALKSRLLVHQKATDDLKKAKHPMRIMCLNKMLTRLNKHIAADNGLIISYDSQGNQIQTKIM